MSSLPLYLRAVKRSALSGRPSLGRLDDRLVFVFGSPRSGTTFLAGAIGSLPGFADLGEVNPLKASIPGVSAREIRTILDRVRRLGLIGSRRAVEQTPETAFVLPAVAEAFPRATLVHALRDGRDVVCSLLERGWLGAERRRRRRCGRCLRHPPALLGGVGEGGGVPAGERRTPLRMGMAELRFRRARERRSRHRGALRAPRHRYSLRDRGARRRARRPSRSDGQCARRRPCVLGRPLAA